jgi:acetate kinase
MSERRSQRVLTINAGSSSLKASVFRLGGGDDGADLEYAALAERVGRQDGRLRLRDAMGASLHDEERGLPDHTAALRVVLEALGPRSVTLDAIGHRVTHGGERYREPAWIDEALLADLRALCPLDPDHLPQALALIEAARQHYPTLPQVACFDTAFHRAMPLVAQRYPLPRALWDAGVRRYGFHGLSYEYILWALAQEDPVAAQGRLVIAHLGSGASMAAVRDGVGLETTMGFTPTGGLMMGTRSGDLDPGVLFYLLQTQGRSADAVSALVNKQSGLLGVSGISADMRDLLAANSDPRAAEAVDLFCYQAKKHLGALIAALGGLNTLIFTGGIGERAALVRERICAGMEVFGVALDAERNQQDAPIISRATSAVTVHVMPTNEDLMIARHTARLIHRRASASEADQSDHS